MHWYGKKGVSKKRKIGHITIVDSSAGETLDKLAQLNADAAESLKRCRPQCSSQIHSTLCCQG